MGNCMRRVSAPECGGEDWGSFGCDDQSRRNGGHLYQQSTPGAYTGQTTQVKLKISKKQLEELLMKADVQGQSVEQVLVQLVHAAAANRFEAPQRPWSHALQSIPE